MDYIEKFGLSARPFQLVPAPKFFVPLKEHRRVLGALLRRLEDDALGAALTGGAGLGKTSILAAFGDLMAKRQAVVLSIAVPIQATQNGALLDLIAQRLGLGSFDHAAEASLAIESFLTERPGSGRRFTIMFIDNAHGLSHTSIAQLLKLIRAVRVQGQPFAVVLAGRPALLSALNGGSITVSNAFAAASLKRLDSADQQSYVKGRLEIAGWTGKPALGAQFFDALDQVARGSPRAINYVMSRSLVEAALDGRREITGPDLIHAARELGQIRRRVRELDGRQAIAARRKTLQAVRSSIDEIAAQLKIQQARLAALEAER